MTNYQKAIKVRKTCEVIKDCRVCPYYKECTNTLYLLFSPLDEDIEVVAKAIEKEKWNVK